MSGAPLGVGIVGTGVISTEYLRNLTQFADIEVRFVADIVEERARSQAEAFDVPASGSFAELLADPLIEIVVNLTNPSAHVEVALQAIAAGKHVWSEKPFALDRESGQRLLDAARAAGLRVGTAPDTFLGAGIQESRRMLESGAIGEVQSALTLLQNAGPELWHPNPDFLFQQGAGPLFDLGPYYLTALVQFFGPVARVSATVSTARSTRIVGSGRRQGESFDVTVPTHVSALYEFESGQHAQCLFSFDSQLPRTQFEVSGISGTLSVPDPNRFDGDLVVHRVRHEPEEQPSAAAAYSRGIGVVELARAIRAGVPERASGEQAFHVLDVMQSTIEAGESGSWVEVRSTVQLAPPLPEGWDAAEATFSTAKTPQRE